MTEGIVHQMPSRKEFQQCDLMGKESALGTGHSQRAQTWTSSDPLAPNCKTCLFLTSGPSPTACSPLPRQEAKAIYAELSREAEERGWETKAFVVDKI